MKLNQAAPSGSIKVEDLSGEQRGLLVSLPTKMQLDARLKTTAWLHEGQPLRRLGIRLLFFQEKQLCLCACAPFGIKFMAIEARWNDFRVVKYQQIARLKQLGQLVKVMVGRIALARDHQKAGAIAGNHRVLSDAARRQLVVVAGKLEVRR